MNILLFLTPKQEVTLLYEDYTIGQALRSMEHASRTASCYPAAEAGPAGPGAGRGRS